MEMSYEYTIIGGVRGMCCTTTMDVTCQSANRETRMFQDGSRNAEKKGIMRYLS